MTLLPFQAGTQERTLLLGVLVPGPPVLSSQKQCPWSPRFPYASHCPLEVILETSILLTERGESQQEECQTVSATRPTPGSSLYFRDPPTRGTSQHSHASTAPRKGRKLNGCLLDKVSRERGGAEPRAPAIPAPRALTLSDDLDKGSAGLGGGFRLLGSA